MSEMDLRILQAIECSSMVSTWKEYLCLEIRDGRAVLSHRRYEWLGNVSDFAVETEEGDEEFRIPEVIDGKPVVGTEDEIIVGGYLTADPSDSESEIELADVDQNQLRDWLDERGFKLNSEIEQLWAGTSIERRVPNVLGGEEVGESDCGLSPIQALDAAAIAPVTRLRIRLQRWQDVSATPENDYGAEVIKDGDRFYYRARGVTVPITEQEARSVISNPFLYYVSTALRLHYMIDAKRKTGNTGTLLALIGECCPDWEILELRTREDWFEALKVEFGVSGFQKDGMEEPADFMIESLEYQEEHSSIDVLDEGVVADWVDEFHDPAVALGPLIHQLQGLAVRDPELQLSPTVITAGMKYCGTITSARIRVRMKRGASVDALDIKPGDCLWESCFDRTFGSMWESPDDY